MDDPLSYLILELSKHLGVPPVTAAVIIPLIITVMNRTARLIPDTATGWKKWVRTTAVVLGLHVKDNTGVPAVVDTTGSVIRRTSVEQVPEPIQGAASMDEPTQVELFTNVKDR